MPQYFSKSLSAASSSVGSISTAATPVFTFTTSAFDTQRRITFSTSTAADYSAIGFTLVGTQQGGNSITETVWGSTTTTTAWTTIQDFLTITSVSMSTAAFGAGSGGPTLIQTNSVGGTPWIAANTAVTPTNIGFGLTYNTTKIPLSTVLEYSFDNPPGQGLQNTLSSFSRPFPITSTSISTAANTNSAGACVLPVACWRMTLTSTSTLGTTTTSSLKAFLSALQTGLGSAL